jgi:hypothetical protein
VFVFVRHWQFVWDDIPTEIALLDESEKMLTEIDSVTRQYDELCASVPLGSDVLDAVTSRKLEQFESRLVDLMQQRRDHAMCYQDLPFPDKVPPPNPPKVRDELQTRAAHIAALQCNAAVYPQAQAAGSVQPLPRVIPAAASRGGKHLKSSSNYTGKPNYKKR